LRISLLAPDRILSSAIASQLTGLKHVEIHIATYGHHNLPCLPPLRQLKEFEHGRGFMALRSLPSLETLRLSVATQDTFHPRDINKAPILKWMRSWEVGIDYAAPSEQPRFSILMML